MNSSLIYKSPMIANEFSFEQSKPLPLGKRLIDACITNETTTRSSYLVFYVTSKSFTEDWENFLDSILSDLTEQELDDQYGVTSKSEARSNLDKWKAKLLGDNRLGYLIVRAETPFKKRPSKISYIDSMTYVCTTPPNQKGQEKVIVPQVKEDPSIIIQCLKSNSYMQDPFSYTVRLSKGFATYKGIDGKQREFLFDGLSEIKSQLFDAPAEVKASFNEVVKYFDIYDEFGSSIRIGDEIIFYYENGVEELHGSNVKTPRLYKGTLKSWDKQNLVATIVTKDFDQIHYGLPKEVKIGQRLISKVK